MTKKRVLFTALLCLCSLLVGAVGIWVGLELTEKPDTTALPIRYASSSRIISHHDKTQMMGWHGYVFVGRIEKQLKTTISPKEEGGFPYTHYQITVIGNLKGELAVGDTVEVRKLGGEANGAIFLFDEEDFLPKVGETYLILSGAERDGSLAMDGPCSNVPLDVVLTESDMQNVKQGITPERLANSAVIQSYNQAKEYQVVFNEDRCLSKYDVKFTRGGEQFVPNVLIQQRDPERDFILYDPLNPPDPDYGQPSTAEGSASVTSSEVNPSTTSGTDSNASITTFSVQ